MMIRYRALIDIVTNTGCVLIGSEMYLKSLHLMKQTEKIVSSNQLLNRGEVIIYFPQGGGEEG